MGLSFRKSISILPSLRLNIGKSGLSVSAGVKGLRASINTKGQVRGTASLPGTGVRYTKSKNISDILPGAKAREEAAKAAKAEKKAELKAAKDAQKAAEKEAAEARKALAKAESAAAKSEEKETEAKTAGRGELAQAIIDIYAIADRRIEWLAIKNSSSPMGMENWDYLKSHADKILDGDIDAYLELINDVNPFAELIELGSSFECGTDSPMKMAVHCTVNSEQVLGEYKDDKLLLEDYAAGVAIKAARDLFALLPLWQVEVTAEENERSILNVKFTRDSFEGLNFERIDASDTVKKLGGIIAVL